MMEDILPHLVFYLLQALQSFCPLGVPPMIFGIIRDEGELVQTGVPALVRRWEVPAGVT
jgi:hypothetical protein